MLRSGPESSLSRAARDAVADALASLGCEHIKFKSGSIHFEVRGEKIQLAEAMLPDWVPSVTAPVDVERLIIAMSDVTGLPVPRAIASDLGLVQARLYPRVVTREAFAGPDRAMCRREIGTDLFAAVWIAVGGQGLWLTTAELDKWPIDFEEALVLARENLERVIDTGSLNEISDGHGVYAVLAEGVDLAGAMIDLPSFFADDFKTGGHGALASAPAPGTLLLLPVRAGGGAEGVASIVQISDMLRDDRLPDELPRRLYWARPTISAGLLGYTLEMLPVIIIHEGGSRRAHVDASDDVQMLLQVLGEID
ncbi:MAG: hypothetical protein RLN60_05030 [Phycisphaerales bacterium]